MGLKTQLFPHELVRILALEIPCSSQGEMCLVLPILTHMEEYTYVISQNFILSAYFSSMDIRHPSHMTLRKISNKPINNEINFL